MRSRGMALLTGLVLMAALSLLALSATSGMILQRHMAANYQEEALALEEATLADAEARGWLFSRPDIQRQGDCREHCILPPGIRPADTLPEDPEWKSAEWWQENGIEAGLNPETGEKRELPPLGTEPARWILGEVHFGPAGDNVDQSEASHQGHYRIFSRGTGLHPGSVVVTESVVSRPWGGDFEPGPVPPLEGANPFCRQFSNRSVCGVLSWRRKR